ncbi:hypothetical protein B0H14DRAFT_2569370 [Mycena olivaceomarginata]|nr:hypothetical protein B0H14DRAFT_2569370 [Mycena olivaceomarginata]
MPRASHNSYTLEKTGRSTTTGWDTPKLKTQRPRCSVSPMMVHPCYSRSLLPIQLEQNSHWKSVVFERLKPTDQVESMDPKDSAYIILRAYYTGSTEAALKASQLFLLEHLHNMGSSPVLLDLCDIMRALDKPNADYNTVRSLWEKFDGRAAPNSSSNAHQYNYRTVYRAIITLKHRLTLEKALEHPPRVTAGAINALPDWLLLELCERLKGSPPEPSATATQLKDEIYRMIEKRFITGQRVPKCLATPSSRFWRVQKSQLKMPAEATPRPLLQFITLVPVEGLRQYLGWTTGSRYKCKQSILEKLEGSTETGRLAMLLGTETVHKVTPTRRALMSYIGVVAVRGMKSKDRVALALKAAAVCSARIKSAQWPHILFSVEVMARLAIQSARWAAILALTLYTAYSQLNYSFVQLSSHSKTKQKRMGSSLGPGEVAPTAEDITVEAAEGEAREGLEPNLQLQSESSYHLHLSAQATTDSPSIEPPTADSTLSQSPTWEAAPNMPSMTEGVITDEVPTGLAVDAAQNQPHKIFQLRLWDTVAWSDVPPIPRRLP